MKLKISALFLMTGIASGVSPAQAKTSCGDQQDVERVATRAVLAVHRASGAAKPLTWEAYSLSSQENAYAVILSYSGSQYVYDVTVRHSDCQVLQVILKQE